MKSKRYFLVGLASLSLLGILSACGGGGAPPVEPPPPPGTIAEVAKANGLTPYWRQRTKRV
jgi:hypothetical protein